MKNIINIFYNKKTNPFLIELFSDYKIFFFNLEEISYTTHNANTNIVIINNQDELSLVNFENLHDNYLVLSSLKKLNLKINKNNIVKTPVSINNIKNIIEKFSENLQIKFHDITIVSERLTNIKNNSFCYLTKAEVEILICLIRERSVNKSHIKENILNIKTGVQTNSLESHLTRIRKKMSKIKTTVKIYSKSEKLLIVI